MKINGMPDGLFDRVAPDYDRMNRVLSLGLDPWWRSRAVAALAAAAGSWRGRAAGPELLDVATGTADLALAAARCFPLASVVGVDVSAGMLELARTKIFAAGLSDRVRVLEGDALALPFHDASFDLAQCAFGFRNFTDLAAGLAEFHRVLRPGGTLLVLEFFRPPVSWAGRLVAGWLWLAGAIFARGRRRDYDWLRRSIAGTVSVPEFLAAAGRAGFAPLSSTRYFPACDCVLLRNLPAAPGD